MSSLLLNSTPNELSLTSERPMWQGKTQMGKKQIAIIGGGAAGFFAAIACARADPQNEISIFERGPEFLTKVRISGGGRCNVTHASFEAREFARHYPRGERALIGALQRFDVTDTLEWFESRGVKLKTEPD